MIGEDEAVIIKVLRETYNEYFKLVHPFLTVLRREKKISLDMTDLEWPSFAQLEQDIADKRTEATLSIAEVKAAPAPEEPIEKPTPEKSKAPKPAQRKTKAFTTGPLGAFELAKRELRKVYGVQRGGSQNRIGPISPSGTGNPVRTSRPGNSGRARQ